MNDLATILALLAVILALDAVFGEPEWLWSRITHPVVLAGRVIGWLDWRLNRADDSHRQQKISGIAAMALLAGGGGLLGFFIESLPGGAFCTVALGAVLLSHKSLVQHVGAVADGLMNGLDEGRRAVARIVGREPESLDADGVARAAIESGAENFSDGVVAPAFWFLIGGLPGLIVYKLVNTADSMIGHRTDKYRHFGWAAARLDDMLNFLPARLTALLFALADLSPDGLKAAFRDARLHRSVNAGWPEAAAAATLGVRLGGPRLYHGESVDEPFLFDEGRAEAGPDDIMEAVNLLWRAWGVMLALCIVGALIL